MPTKIRYLDEVWNIVTGCSKASPGCENCYAARYAVTRGKHLAAYQDLAYLDKHGRPQWTGEVRLHPAKLSEPLHWRKPRRIGVAFTGDLFHEAVPDEFIGQVWSVMHRAHLAFGHTFLVLTKRPERINRVLGPNGIGWYAKEGLVPNPEPGIWLGVTVENQEEANRRISLLLQTPAAKRWVSLEPMLGPIKLGWDEATGSADDGALGLDWVVVGCESGPGARPMKLAWVRSVKDQCVAAGVPFYFKQEMSFGTLVHGPRLDGCQWLEMPT